MHVYSRHATNRREVYQPNKDVTRLLVNPEQALKKNLKPIKTAHTKERPPLRSLFSTRQAKLGPLVDGSFQHQNKNQSLHRYPTKSRRRSPKNTLLKLSHDVTNTTGIMGSGKGGDLVSQFSNMHQRNMTQLPMGGKYPQN